MLLTFAVIIINSLSAVARSPDDLSVTKEPYSELVSMSLNEIVPQPSPESILSVLIVSKTDWLYSIFPEIAPTPCSLSILLILTIKVTTSPLIICVESFAVIFTV